MLEELVSRFQFLYKNCKKNPFLYIQHHNHRQLQYPQDISHYLVLEL